MYRKVLKIVLGMVLILVIVIAGYVFYLYQKGGTDNYIPPAKETLSPQVQLQSDLTALSRAMEAYWAKNLKYPDKLEQLKPEFVEKIPLEADTYKPFIYETDGMDHYRITVSDPSRYGLKELVIENGEIKKK